MRVAVVGAGAIGAYIGAALARAGTDVHLIARGANLEAIRRHGVQVLSPRGDFSVRPPATADPNEVGPVDVVVLGLKAHDYRSAGPLLAPLLGPETAVVAAQNGIPWWYFHRLTGPYEDHRIEAVDPDGAVSSIIPPSRAIGCVVYSSTELEQPGVVRHIEGTRFSIGEPDGTISPRCTSFSEAMVAGGLKCPVESRIRDDIWIKLIGNVAFNPISALTQATMAQICGHADTRALVVSLMEESLEVARRLGSEPRITIERRLAGAERVGDHRTSMLQDLEAGKRFELAPIVDAVIELAELTQTEVPSLRAIGAVTSLLDETLATNRGGLLLSGIRTLNS